MIPMLNVYDCEYATSEIKDIEAAFSKLKIVVDETTKQFVKEIDKGELIDANRFIDRFGTILYISELSTGCKAAFCTYFYPDKIVDLQECGRNARDAIFNYCENGRILLHDFGVTIDNMGTRKSCIQYAGKTFDLERFNDEVM